MPNDETAQAKVLEALSKYKDQLLMNQRLVQNGAIKPEDNLIFNENGKQTFNILAENLNEFDKQLEIVDGICEKCSAFVIINPVSSICFILLKINDVYL